MPDLAQLLERLGDAGTAAALGAVLGLGFGFLAQRSRFCIRSAVIEVSGGAPGRATAVWLTALAAAVAGAAVAMSAGAVTLDSITLRANPASLSGALVGGLMFGAGMVLARGCASRHLVLAATGNLRAWATFSIFAVTAAAAAVGPLAPLRRMIAAQWVLAPDRNDILATAGVDPVVALVLAIGLLVVAVLIGAARAVPRSALAAGSAIGAVLVAGWVLSSALAAQTFDPTPVESIAFTRPAITSVQAAGSWFAVAPRFDFGLLLGVLVGAFAGGWVSGELRLQGFPTVRSIGRYGLGAALTGIGGTLAVGCSVGAMANAVLMIATSWSALGAMAIGAAITHLVIDRPARDETRPALGTVARSANVAAA